MNLMIWDAGLGRVLSLAASRASDLTRLMRGKWGRSGTLRLFPVPQPGRRIHRWDGTGAGRDADLRLMNLTQAD